MNLQQSSTEELIRAAREQAAAGRIEASLILELQTRYNRSTATADERKAIRELDRSVFIPHFGATKLPPDIVPVPGAKVLPQLKIPQLKSRRKRRIGPPAQLGDIVRKALLELLQTKHLFQCVHVQLSEMLEPVPKKTKPSEEMPEMIRLMHAGLVEIPRKQAKLANSLTQFKFNQSWQFTCEANLSVKDEETGSISLPLIRIHCGHCDTVNSLHRPKTDASTAASWSFQKGSEETTLTQIFALSYQCQNCHEEPVIFFVRRDKDKLTLLGRSQFEPISVPSCIPKHIARFYRNAHIALKTGHPLAAIFYLRTTIEQYMRKIVKLAARVSGEELAEQYNKQLPSDFPGRLPSLKKIYQDLSAALHDAREDEELFRISCAGIERHLEAVAVFGL
jgi:hypothetical protein